ncbi:hypothetical protein JVT61DRAFT_8433 [Boletus reticuloceps]|uniref:Uncharacterized protein n=1 Tax=Boletus reticuloceps TaxID=495285 RepID=A0A8I2Z086_9AGAM|nr:hypothetical protein JVT61DRAFT_8433 [Boletus reticuloceps]
MDPISGMSDGSSRILVHPSVSKQYEHWPSFKRNPSMWAQSHILPNGSNHDCLKWWRTADIGVLSAIDSNALAICRRVADGRVSAIAGRNKGQRTKSRVGVKALAMLLVKWGKALDRASEAAEEDSETDEGDSGPSRRTHLPLSSGVDPRGRIPLAVEAL